MRRERSRAYHQHTNYHDEQEALCSSPLLLKTRKRAGGLTRSLLFCPNGKMKKEIKNKAIRRLKIIEGQIRGLQHMVDKDVYCVDVINQSLAIKEALSGVEDLLLENHLATHAAEQMKSGKKKKAIKEILSLYKLSKKK